jgi:hypothetical protein
MGQEKIPKLYGCMSKVEFKKWKNKWELYKIFHPDRCRREIYCTIDCRKITLKTKKQRRPCNGCFRYCLALLPTGELVIRDYESPWLEGDDTWCVEWIKYV